MNYQLQSELKKTVCFDLKYKYCISHFIIIFCRIQLNLYFIYLHLLPIADSKKFINGTIYYSKLYNIIYSKDCIYDLFRILFI